MENDQVIEKVVNSTEEVNSIEEVKTENKEDPAAQLVDVKYDDPDFVDPTPSDDVVDKQDVIIYLQNKQIDFLQKKLDQDKEFFESVNKKLDELVSQNIDGDSILSDSNDQIITRLDSLIDNQSTILTGSSTIVTYGVLYIPLAIICFLLWRFFATFLRSAR
ncbi:hypothetical protein [Heyndrickxia sporothermodurans]|uniref:hypothetical protein n=1 Tax=Heyndrickxia sporothermodurans TaxID=46224 RepID=UPI002E1FD59E|nr:hypothetical protein [Heyndrickxia sporothermodurans]